MNQAVIYFFVVSIFTGNPLKIVCSLDTNGQVSLDFEGMGELAVRYC